MVKQGVANAIDWVVVGLTAVLFLVSITGAGYALKYHGSKKRPVAKEFNFLWRVRCFTMLVAAMYALAQLLRLQVLWGPESVFKQGGYYPTTFCRIYLALTYGVFEPAFLLLALFTCKCSMQSRESLDHPNLYITTLAVGLTLPFCAAQVVCALFTWIKDLNYGKWLNRSFFAVYDDRLQEHCYKGELGNCRFCVFPLLSTLISASFAGLYLLTLWYVTSKIVSSVINKVLIRQVRLLQLLVSTFLCLALACRGLTVIFEPFELGFELFRFFHVVMLFAMVSTIEYILVLKPVYDAHIADKYLKSAAQPVPSVISGKTEQVPLVLFNPPEEKA